MLNLPFQGLIRPGRTPGSKQLVHFLESAAFGLGDEEPHVEHPNGGDAAKEDEGPIAGSRNKRGG